MKTTVLENLDLYELASGKWNSIMFTLVEKVVLFQTNCILIKIRKTKGMWKAIILDINNAEILVMKVSRWTWYTNTDSNST